MKTNRFSFQVKVSRARAVVFWLCMCLFQAAQAADVPIALAVDGKPSAMIVLPNHATRRSPERAAAELLVRHIKQMSGAVMEVKRVQELPQIRIEKERLLMALEPVDLEIPDEALLGTEGIPGEEAVMSGAPLNFVLIGRSELTERLGVDLADVGVGGIRLLTVRNAVVLLGGPDSVPGEPGTDAGGLEHAVLELLEQLGCRYLWPDHTGRIIPVRSTVVIEPLDVRYTPQIRRRGIRWGRWTERSDLGAKHLGLTREQIEQWQKESDERNDVQAAAHAQDISWLRLHRLGGRMPGFGHAGGGLRDAARIMHDHPEWFALQGDGSRDQGGDSRFRICHANPDLIEHVANDIIARVDADPGLTLVGIDENDGGSNTGFCLCDKCRALDPANAPKIRLMTFGERVRPDRPTRRREIWEHAALTDRLTWYWNGIAERVTAVHPNVRLGVSVYSIWTDPPVARKLHPNLVARYVPADSSLLQGWQEAGLSELYWRPNVLLFNRRDGKLKSLLGHLCQEFKLFMDAGVRQTDFDSITQSWSTAGLSFYAAARLHWNPDLTAAEIMDDYASNGFGRGAEYIKAYWLRVEELTPAVKMSHAVRADFIYTPQVMTELRGFLNAAAAAESDNPAIVARVAFLRLGLNLTELHETLDDLARRARANEPDYNAAQALRLLDLNHLVMVDMMVNHPLAVNIAQVTWGSGGFAKWRPLSPIPTRLSDEKFRERVQDPEYGLTGAEDSIADMFRAFGLAEAAGFNASQNNN